MTTPLLGLAGLLDTSVAVDLESFPLDGQFTIAAITLAELAAGPYAAENELERARRQYNLQRAESLFGVLPFDADAARVYGIVFAATLAAGRKARGPRAVDLLIAAVALSNGLPLYTRNPSDFDHLTAVGLNVRTL